VLVINNGEIVEQGTHQELLDKKRLLPPPVSQPVQGAGISEVLFRNAVAIHNGFLKDPSRQTRCNAGWQITLTSAWWR
jgi:hypothetical protein